MYDRNEYACLNPNLSCVRYILDLIQCDKEIAEAEDALKNAETAALCKGKGLLKALLERMKGFDKPIIEEREVARVNLFRSLLSRDANPINERELDRTAENLYVSFAKLDSKAFEEFFKTQFALEVAESAEATKEVQSARGKRTNARSRRKRIVSEAMENAFRDGVPNRFRDRSVGLDLTQEQMCEYILMSFYRDWKDRAPLFEVPVSVTGVGIYSMGAERRETWFRAYQAFGLDKLKRSNVFQYHVATPEVESWTAVTVLRGEEPPQNDA